MLSTRGQQHKLLKSRRCLRKTLRPLRFKILGLNTQNLKTQRSQRNTAENAEKILQRAHVRQELGVCLGFAELIDQQFHRFDR